MSSSVETFGKSGSIVNDLQQFQEIVQELSRKLDGVSSIWNDSNYQKLYAAIAQLAEESAEVMNAGEDTMNCLNQFDAIAGEKI